MSDETKENLESSLNKEQTRIDLDANKVEVKEEAKGEDKPEKEEYKKSMAREIMEWIGCIVVAFTLAIFIKYFIFTPTLVMQNSMYPTIFNGDRVWVNRLARTFKWELHRGDIITLEAPDDKVKDQNIASYTEHTGFDGFLFNVVEINKISYIKRIIGLPGDKVRIDEGKVFINDEELDESAYLPDGTITYLDPNTPHVDEEFIVPDGYVFAMGDNRESSKDCRILGCIPLEKVEGRVVGRIWPLDRFGAIEKSTITSEEVIKHNEQVRKGLI